MISNHLLASGVILQVPLTFRTYGRSLWPGIVINIFLTAGILP